MKSNTQQGFTLVEVIAAAFVLSVAVASLFLVSARSLVLNSQAARTHGAILLAEDVFASVQRFVYDNALKEKDLFDAPFDACKSGRTCQLGITSSLTTLFQECDGQCEPVVRTSGDNFFAQDPNETATGVDTGYDREIQMTLLTDAEMKVSVTIRWQDRGQSFEKKFERTFVDWYNMGAYYNYGRVIATVVECATEADLPNWGESEGPGVITKDTATDYVNANAGCFLSPGWQFQWGYLTWGHEEGGGLYTINESAWVDNTAADHVGEADGTDGPGTDTWDPVINSNRNPFTNEWRTFGDTDVDGRTAIIIPEPTASNFALRLIMKPGYIPFSYYYDDDDWQNAPDPDNYSAEMYCRDDIENYDNFDYIDIQSGPTVYYCNAFVAPIEPIDYGECVYVSEDQTETVISLGDQFLNPGSSVSGPIISTSIAEGNYTVRLQSFDGDSSRVAYSDQPREQYYVSFLDSGNNEIARTDDSVDVPDGVSEAGWAGVVSEPLNIPAGVSAIQVRHSFPDETEENSLEAICMHLDES